MNVRPLFAFSLAVALVAAPLPTLAQAMPGTQASSTRPVHRTLPHTDMIRRAWAAGTRDATGRPGPHYWQLWMDYTIHAGFDPASGRVTGRESVVIHNASDSAMAALTNTSTR